jgi:hypothetical protein
LGIILASGLISLGPAEGGRNPVGSGDGDWWVSHPNSGFNVTHPDWVLESLKAGPVLIYVHRDCDNCRPQTKAVEKIATEYRGELTYYNLSAAISDVRSIEAVNSYDPNGEAPLVPMTILVTLAPDLSGKVRAVWHSKENLTGEVWVRGYVEDAIYYYKQNSGSWKKG